ncbi:MAG: glucose-6-phosphate isomerase [Flavobacteriia bacterium]|nr:glucose-6-phosphate isomerase [Flavobacteriia bacterium]OIP46419.1 MAG: glucose-6-phosphate isomerase [Flavobacteriaceae bacterium CG2_30_31_66]PIV96529.1 MAG: glucose-6-phosphate isomerase [Flavobacteriaceae bacterium CG17_big_fil_post_rev_8_21_14_2_50_31_13]PIX12422.1 MAG: glucose-6-phosphate isomerase [Flavobacteriaceae bacterium CG_4_8_14_3_um_filter_31_8]PIY16051.1 MAG: glucose-6-phosphate isomerase [Flavobacteriaceae bacterium CG_4_10_14_3_um_filter_31_253]PIZ09900.1 MAG: glucose-6-ph
MFLKNSNPTKTISWQKLTNHFHNIQNDTIKEYYKDPNRKSDFSLQLNDLSVDFSKNRINKETVQLLVELAKEVGLKEAIESQFSGEIINVTENRAVLHTALRSNSDEPILVDEKNIKPQIQASLKKIKSFSSKVITGKWKGYSGKSITDIVNIGIGGSDLGPDMIVESLKFYKNQLNTHFVSNIDGDHVSEIIKKLNPETTLFVIVSKTFTTQETLSNAETIKNWFLKSATIFDIPKHFVAVSTNLQAVDNFGISIENVFTMWDWVGGRFSLWSAVGLSISLSVGFENYKALLDGAEEMDIHFRNEDFDKNIPVVLALISIWYNNFYNAETEAVLPYSQYLSKLPAYLQQAIMESNGKGVDRNGEKIEYQTGTIVWGSTGTNMQHAFMQLVHQGTKLIPADFIGFKESLYGLTDHHKKLMANLYGQMDALAFGKTAEEVHLELKFSGKEDKIATLLPFKVFEGNRPSNLLLFDKLTPESLGKLVALYEHKIFTQGILWNIYSYDQFGVELGKELANKFLKNQ